MFKTKLQRAILYNYLSKLKCAVELEKNTKHQHWSHQVKTLIAYKKVTASTRHADRQDARSSEAGLSVGNDEIKFRIQLKLLNSNNPTDNIILP